MSEQNVRKASDILIILEVKIDSLFKLVQNLDNNIKLILNGLNSNSISKSTEIHENVIKNEIQEIKKSIMPGLRENVVLGPNGLQLQNSDTNKIKVEENENFDFHQINSEPVNNIENSVKKVAVQQRITYPDGKNICLANIEIKKTNGELLKKIRTNAMGKWLTSLEPGEYVVNVSKSANKINPDVELSFPISVPESDRPIELPIPKI